MKKFKYIYGPVPSRRMGNSLGISPIPEKTCNYSCVYCQLGRTDHLSNIREEFFPLEDILSELRDYNVGEHDIDVISIVGEGEPTLYSRLGELIISIKEITKKPVAVITNGALLYDKEVRKELMAADIVLPSVDAYSEEIYKKIDRPYGKFKFNTIRKGLIDFSDEYKGQLHLEIMLVDGFNSSDEDIEAFKEYLKKINYDKVYINTCVRPPAESNVKPVGHDRIAHAVNELNGISIDMLASGSFYSDTENTYDAVLSISSRHPLSQFELKSFLYSRDLSEEDIDSMIAKLSVDERVTVINYGGIKTYRSRKDKRGN
ncbi:MAG: radical SAM protein [Peptostreptococcaceae bacterium]|nr:radical SAM protein [Peptostreptococcaceae bacterium]